MTDQTTPTQIETTTVSALVTLQIAPREGQTLAEARADMLEQFQDYLTSSEHPFLGDYGATVEALQAYRADDEDAEEPTWGGYEGPYVTSVQVTPQPPATGSAQWYREMGDVYARRAAEPGHPTRTAANEAEAAKYYAIADRLLATQLADD